MKHLFLLFIFFFSVQIYAAENAYMTERAVQNRKEHAAAMQKAHDTLDRSIAALNNGSTVTQSGSASSTVSDGSKVTGGGKVTKPINPSAVAKTIVERLGKAKALAKASLPSFLGSAALNGLIAAVGWVMDEGGKITYKDPDDPSSLVPSDACSSSYLLKPNLTTSQAVQSIKNSVNRRDPSQFAKDFVAVTSISCLQATVVIQYTTKWCKTSCGSGVINTYDPPDLIFYDNKSYYDILSTTGGNNNPSSAPVVVTPQQLEDKITNYITNNTTNNITNNIVNNAYSNDSSNGATASDPSNALAKEGANDIRSAIDKASTANGSEPTSAGKKGYYMITDGTKTIEGYVDPKGLSTPSNTDSTSTTTNPDGSTSTTTGTSKSEFVLPAFCDWASVMCDWYKDWKDFIKEEDTDNEQPQEPDTTVLDRDFDTKFEVNAQCPPNPKIEFPIVGPVELGFNKICDFFSFLKFGVLTASSMLACWIVSSAVRGGE